jgi:hypothetical protein
MLVKSIDEFFGFVYLSGSDIPLDNPELRFEDFFHHPYQSVLAVKPVTFDVIEFKAAYVNASMGIVLALALYHAVRTMQEAFAGRFIKLFLALSTKPRFAVFYSLAASDGLASCKHNRYLYKPVALNTFRAGGLTRRRNRERKKKL